MGCMKLIESGARTDAATLDDDVESACSSAPRAQHSSETAPVQTSRILLAEDSRPIRIRLRSMLKELDVSLEVLESESMAETRHLLEQHAIRLIVLDLQLVDGSSMPLIPEIKRRHPRCILCVLTGFEAPQFRKRCLELGADFFFLKSGDLEGLLNIVNNIASPRPKRDAS